MEINLKQLEAFVITAEYCSFTQAASALYLTQSTVSAHINSLEQILGARADSAGRTAAGDADGAGAAGL